AATGPAVRTGTLLPGETEIEETRGSWRWQATPAGPGTTPPVTAPAGAAPAEAAPAGPAPSADEPEAAKPPTLSAPRDGKPDNLKEIKGVGPKLEALLNRLGFYHFDQIAAWSEAEIEWVDAHLEGFRGRIRRDDWIAQAKILAQGGKTEFSDRVKKGGVY
ncbi:MAG: fused NADH-quinone oxidoreductase subunit E/endonuclease, partial [Alphaproteobacteria bacterium]